MKVNLALEIVCKGGDGWRGCNSVALELDSKKSIRKTTKVLFSFVTEDVTRRGRKKETALGPGHNKNYYCSGPYNCKDRRR